MKVSIIGPGRVGSAIGLVLAARGYVDDLVLLGRRAEVAAGEAADLRHASALTRPTRVRGGGVEETAGSDVVVLSLACGTQDPTSSRAAAGPANAAAFRELVPALAAVSPAAVLLVASNPLDALTTLTLRLSDFPPGRVIGTGTLLDTMRLRLRLSEACGVHPNDIRVYVLGEHGDTQFVHWSSANLGGGPLPIAAERLRRLEADIRAAGHDIARLKGFTNHGVALAAAEVIGAIATDSRAVMPLSVLVRGVAGVEGVCLSLPVVVGRGGVTRTLDLSFSPDEATALRRSADVVAGHLADMD